jgi:arginine/ornithine transport system permease protein
MLHGFGPALAAGALSTLKIVVLSLAVATVFGALGAAAKLSAWRPLVLLAQTYTTLIRGLPELVLLLFIFYGGQMLVNDLAQAAGWSYIDVDPTTAGVLTLGFIYGAYLTETFRGAVLSIPAGQREAAIAFGMTRLQMVRRVLAPQMVPLALPGFANNLLVLIKGSALVSLIGLDDLMHRAGLAASATREPFSFYMAAGAMYLALTTAAIVLMRWAERSSGVHRWRRQAAA